MKIQAFPRRTELAEIPDYVMSKVTESENAIDIVTFKYKTIPPQYRKVSENEWECYKTKERIKAKKADKTLPRSRESLHRTFKRIQKTIRHNFFGQHSEVFITLTFDRRITDTTELSTAFDNFWNKLNRDCHITSSYAPPYRALVVVEPLGTDQYHLHVLLKRLDGRRLYIPAYVLNKMWTNGIAYIQTLYYAEGIGEYLDVLRVKKKRATLKFYKRNLKISRKYGTFAKITKSDMEHGEAVKLAEEKQLTQQNAYAFDIIQPLPEPNLGEVKINTVTTEHWSAAKRRYKHQKSICEFRGFDF